MCDPGSIAAAIAITASVATTVQQQQSSNVENTYQRTLYGQRKDAALDTFAQIQERTFQERNAAAQQAAAVAQQARQAQATAKLTALESGTRGPSVDVLMNAFQANEANNLVAVRTNLANQEAQLQAEARAAGRLQGPNVSMGPLSSPLGVAVSGLNAASAGFNAYQAFQPAPPPLPAQ